MASGSSSLPVGWEWMQNMAPGTGRPCISSHQAAGSSGLGTECGSLAGRHLPSPFPPSSSWFFLLSALPPPSSPCSFSSGSGWGPPKQEAGAMSSKSVRAVIPATPVNLSRPQLPT